MKNSYHILRCYISHFTFITKCEEKSTIAKVSRSEQTETLSLYKMRKS